MANEFTPQQRHALADAAGRLRLARAEVRDKADTVDARIRDLLARLDLTRTDPETELLVDAIMGLSLTADAARAYARDDLDSAAELGRSVAGYARNVMGEG